MTVILILESIASRVSNGESPIGTLDPIKGAYWRISIRHPWSLSLAGDQGCRHYKGSRVPHQGVQHYTRLGLSPTAATLLGSWCCTK